jgi:AcrR family transcriptional regulator
MTAPPHDDAAGTRESLLDAAEQLFAEQGIAASSVRAITRAAGVHLAAVSYHFGSKEGLVREVLRRRLAPLNDERLRRLEELERRHAPGPPPVDEILRAFLHPVVRYVGDPGARGFSRLLLRAFLEPAEELRLLVVGQFRPVAVRYEEALAAAAPHLDRDEIVWRLHFTIGALAHTAGHARLIEAVSGGACDLSDAERVTEELVCYATAGFLAGRSPGGGR